ncbi:MAG: hypothetical protein B1H12_11200 [Desulfobacteraceae bacterium 4484_190.2]|nr:MAG: hypothetical protein B1H12_11200 [Desulfobacteraceae bacterium 4484_190.2]
MIAGAGFELKTFVFGIQIPTFLPISINLQRTLILKAFASISFILTSFKLLYNIIYALGIMLGIMLNFRSL